MAPKQVKTHASLVEISDSDDEDQQVFIRDLTNIDQIVETSDSDDEDVHIVKDLTRTDHNTPTGGSSTQTRRRNVVVEKEAESDDDLDLESDDDMISEEAHPSFKVTLKKYHKTKLRVPKKFIDAAGSKNRSALVLQFPPNQRLWPVILIYSPSHALFDLSAGWSKFRISNGLEFNKTYVFEYIRDTNVTEVKLQTTSEENPSKSLTFSKELKQHNFSNGRLEMPTCFVMASGISKNRKIKLEDAQGRQWPVKVTNRNLGRFGFTAGWKAFLNANKNMVVGTTISFEFVPNSDNVVRVRAGS